MRAQSSHSRSGSPGITRALPGTVLECEGAAGLGPGLGLWQPLLGATARGHRELSCPACRPSSGTLRPAPAGAAAAVCRLPGGPRGSALAVPCVGAAWPQEQAQGPGPSSPGRVHQQPRRRGGRSGRLTQPGRPGGARPEPALLRLRGLSASSSRPCLLAAPRGRRCCGHPDGGAGWGHPRVLAPRQGLRAGGRAALTGPRAQSPRCIRALGSRPLARGPGGTAGVAGQGLCWARPCGAGAELLWGSPRLHPRHTAHGRTCPHTLLMSERGSAHLGNYSRDGALLRVPGMATARAGVTGTARAEGMAALPHDFTSVLTCAEKQPQPWEPGTPFPLPAAGRQACPGGSLRCDLPLHTLIPTPSRSPLPHGTPWPCPSRSP